jgi:peptidoglycan-associated lipoprotein
MVLNRKALGSVACAFGLVLTACGGQKKPVAQAPPPAPVMTSETIITSAPVFAAKRVSPMISVEEEILRRCSLHFDDFETAPKFEFDKSDLLPADHEILGQIGHCVLSGPLMGRSLKLIGRADPRGATEYNMALGARRAHSVAVFLEQFGVAKERLRVTSRGELDATGSDEATWQMDRRVDIVLAE